MTLDIETLLTELTLKEKASLTSGSSFWYTAPVERLGIPKIMVSDVDAPLDELQAIYGDVPFAAGYGIGDTTDDPALLGEAERVAATVDTVVMMIGLPERTSRKASTARTCSFRPTSSPR